MQSFLKSIKNIALVDIGELIFDASEPEVKIREVTNIEEGDGYLRLYFSDGGTWYTPHHHSVMIARDGVTASEINGE